MAISFPVRVIHRIIYMLFSVKGRGQGRDMKSADLWHNIIGGLLEYEGHETDCRTCSLPQGIVGTARRSAVDNVFLRQVFTLLMLDPFLEAIDLKPAFDILKQLCKDVLLMGLGNNSQIIKNIHETVPFSCTTLFT